MCTSRRQVVVVKFPSYIADCIIYTRWREKRLKTDLIDSPPPTCWSTTTTFLFSRFISTSKVTNHLGSREMFSTPTCIYAWYGMCYTHAYVSPGDCCRSNLVVIVQQHAKHKKVRPTSRHPPTAPTSLPALSTHVTKQTTTV